MKTLEQLCTPRQSVFDVSKRDTVLSLTQLAAGRIDGPAFLEENHVTDGMRALLIEAFRRLEGKSEQAVFKLTQAMGGGKTHNLITLGMLAKHPDLRPQVLPGLPTSKELGPVRVVAFSGRETDVPHGIWGEIARQIGRFDRFKDYYSPLKAPGRTAWINLLKGEPTLILLDELPPYLDNAKSIAIGNSDLSRVTTTALTNLFEAVAEKDLGKVCVVLTDLVGTYAEASAQIQAVLQQLQQEAQRHAMNLTPVQINTDEFYHILRKRLFTSLPKEGEIDEVAQGYAKAVREARQMDITAQSPEQFAQLVKSAYPFHPAIRDPYARFRENPGFQQTRALIRIMRIIASRLWTSGEAKSRCLISVHDLDLNDAETLSEIRQINPTLENAIAHDIAAQGAAVAEVMDQNLGGSGARDVCRLLFVASLANIPNAVLGLSIPELVAYLCAPGRNLAKLKGDVLEKLATAAWYLHSNRDGKLFFKNVENLIAKLESLARTYVREQSLQELRQRLSELFKPVNGWCYQEVRPLPALDEITLSADRTTIVITEPHLPQGLNPQLRQFWEQTTFKNRAAFLQGNQDVLNAADFLMTFEGNRYQGEDQVLQVLRDKQKFGVVLRQGARQQSRCSDPGRPLKRASHSLRTRYYDSVRWLAGELTEDLQGEPIGLYAGSGKSGIWENGRFAVAAREDIKQRVQRGRLRLLLGTDAASEGLNLQRLGTLINLDLPWNPTRLEHRKGRIQRIGHLNDTVHIYNLRYLESIEDRVHHLLSSRLQDIYTLFGQIPDVLEDVWIEVAMGEIERAKQIIATIPRRHPFDLKYQRISKIDWESCERVLSAQAARAVLTRGW